MKEIPEKIVKLLKSTSLEDCVLGMHLLIPYFNTSNSFGTYLVELAQEIGIERNISYFDTAIWKTESWTDFYNKNKYDRENT